VEEELLGAGRGLQRLLFDARRAKAISGPRSFLLRVSTTGGDAARAAISWCAAAGARAAWERAEAVVARERARRTMHLLMDGIAGYRFGCYLGILKLILLNEGSTAQTNERDYSEGNGLDIKKGGLVYLTSACVVRKKISAKNRPSNTSVPFSRRLFAARH
jgi:hypothetical protein